jgi:hypothetical protein
MRYKNFEIEPAVRESMDGRSFTPRAILTVLSVPGRPKRLQWPDTQCKSREAAERTAIANPKQAIDLGDFD